MPSPLVAPAVSSERITLPGAPERHTKGDFPWMASVAPIVVALGIWALTQSPFALMFAFLGPLVAVASTLDGARQSRKRARAERNRFIAQLQDCRDKIERAHERERAIGRSSAAHHVMARASRDPDWWRQRLDEPVWVVVGRGSIPSTVEISGGLGAERAEYPDLAAQEDLLREQARVVDDAAVEVDAREFIGVAASTPVANSLARAVLAQLMVGLSPRSVQTVFSPAAAVSWLSAGPHSHRDAADPGDTGVWFSALPNSAPHAVAGARGEVEGILCDVADREHSLSRRCRVTITVDDEGCARISGPGAPARIDNFRPYFLSEIDAWALARRAHESAAAEGLLENDNAVPNQVKWRELNPSESPVPTAARSRRGELIAHFAVGQELDPIDLVSDGPHAIVGGTTGTGKSELLISWVLSLARAYSPDEVTFLLADFKGGSAFAALGVLPHVVGTITDLDAHVAVRALESLRAEVRLREAVIAECGVRHIDELVAPDTLPRLVVVVDEFAVVLGEFPDLAALFEDLAARGRSLGIHLILCTQRPAGVVRDTIASNCTLRISLRVNNPADSVSVVGTAEAAALPREPYGRCIISTGERPRVAQIALSTPADVTAVAEVSHTDVPVRRPWCEPLPHMIEAWPESVSGHLTFGLADHPETQKQPAARYRPHNEGNLLIIGSHRSGKSTLLATLARAAAASTAYRTVRLGADEEQVWDHICQALRAPADTLYLIDDLDAVLERFDTDHELEFRRHLTQLLREGARRNIYTVATVRHVNSAIHTLTAQFSSTILLHTPTRNDHVLAGGDGASYRSTRIPGRGWWNAHEVQALYTPPEQVACAADTPGAADTSGAASPSRVPLRDVVPAMTRSGGLLIISPQALAVAQSIADPDPSRGITPAHEITAVHEISAVHEVTPVSEGGTTLTIGAAVGARIIVGDPVAWQEQWNRIPALLSRYPALIHGCTVTEFRSLLGTRNLPPPLSSTPGGAWMHYPDGRIQRVQTPPFLADRAVDPATTACSIGEV